MLRKNAAEEIAHNMTENLKEPTPVSKLSEAFEHLNAAAELFDSVGNDKYAELVTNIIAKLAKDVCS